MRAYPASPGAIATMAVSMPTAGRRTSKTIRAGTAKTARSAMQIIPMSSTRRVDRAVSSVSPGRPGSAAASDRRGKTAVAMGTARTA